MSVNSSDAVGGIPFCGDASSCGFTLSLSFGHGLSFESSGLEMEVDSRVIFDDLIHTTSPGFAEKSSVDSSDKIPVDKIFPGEVSHYTACTQQLLLPILFTKREREREREAHREKV